MLQGTISSTVELQNKEIEVAEVRVRAAAAERREGAWQELYRASRGGGYGEVGEHYRSGINSCLDVHHKGHLHSVSEEGDMNVVLYSRLKEEVGVERLTWGSR